jgi:hypothetical protein
MCFKTKLFNYELFIRFFNLDFNSLKGLISLPHETYFKPQINLSNNTALILSLIFIIPKTSIRLCETLNENICFRNSLHIKCINSQGKKLETYNRAANFVFFVRCVCEPVAPEREWTAYIQTFGFTHSREAWTQSKAWT